MVMYVFHILTTFVWPYSKGYKEFMIFFFFKGKEKKNWVGKLTYDSYSYSLFFLFGYWVVPMNF